MFFSNLVRASIQFMFAKVPKQKSRRFGNYCNSAANSAARSGATRAAGHLRAAPEERRQSGHHGRRRERAGGGFRTERARERSKSNTKHDRERVMIVADFLFCFVFLYSYVFDMLWVPQTSTVCTYVHPVKTAFQGGLR